MLENRVVSQSKWLEAQRAFLAKEKALTYQRDALVKERLQLPWVKMTKEYVFDTAEGRKTLGELFGGKSQLLIYHFMFGPDWEQGCPSCSMLVDGIDRSVVHAGERDVMVVAVSGAPLEKIEPFKKRMGWSVSWVSSYGTDFNHDFGVTFTPEEMKGTKFYNFGTGTHPSEEAPGISVFYRNEAGEVFHTYSSYGRGPEGMLPVYTLLDMVPKGRNEEGLSFPMAWVRHRDRYESAKAADHACCGARQ